MGFVCFRLNTGESMHGFCVRNGLSTKTAWVKADSGMSPDDVVEYLMANKGRGRGLNNCKNLLSSGKSLVSEIRRLGLSEFNGRKLVIEKKMSPDEALKELILAKKEKRKIKWKK